MEAREARAGDRPGGRRDPEPSAARIRVLLEHGPSALSRVFDLLCTLQLVPAAISALAGADAIRLDLAFEAAPPERLDLLQRKLAQLVECLGVTHSSSGADAIGLY